MENNLLNWLLDCFHHYWPDPCSRFILMKICNSTTLPPAPPPTACIFPLQRCTKWFITQCKYNLALAKKQGSSYWSERLLAGVHKRRVFWRQLLVCDMMFYFFPASDVHVHWFRFCAKCKEHANLRRKVGVSIPPRVLIVYLKRFDQDA